MPSDRFIAREDDVLDLETGISYSTVNDSEVVADLLNSLATPEPVSGGVEVAAREALELAEEAMTYVSDHFRKKWSMDERRAKIAAALSQLEAEAEGEQEAVVLEGPKSRIRANMPHALDDGVQYRAVFSPIQKGEGA